MHQHLRNSWNDQEHRKKLKKLLSSLIIPSLEIYANEFHEYNSNSNSNSNMESCTTDDIRRHLHDKKAHSAVVTPANGTPKPRDATNRGNNTFIELPDINSLEKAKHALNDIDRIENQLSIYH